MVCTINQQSLLRWTLLYSLLVTHTAAFTIQRTTRPVSAPRTLRSRHSQRLHAVADPVELANVVTTGLQHIDSVVAQTAATTASSTPVESLLSSLYTAAADVSLAPAHEHTQSFWGTADPYLTAGKSIAPTAKALQDLGITAIPSPPVNLPEAFSQQVQSAAAKGWHILDSSALQAESNLPGFLPTRGILAGHNPTVPLETAESFAAQVEWSAKFINVVDKLPYAAFAYAFIEFFLLRPNVDLYQQDIDEDSTGILAETLAVTAVRMGVFAVVAVVTVGIFG